MTGPHWKAGHDPCGVCPMRGFMYVLCRHVFSYTYELFMNGRFCIAGMVSVCAREGTGVLRVCARLEGAVVYLWVGRCHVWVPFLWPCRGVARCWRGRPAGCVCGSACWVSCTGGAGLELRSGGSVASEKPPGCVPGNCGAVGTAVRGAPGGECAGCVYGIVGSRARTRLCVCNILCGILL